MRSSFEREDFLSQQGENLKEYEAIARIFNEAVAEILLSKPYSLLFAKVYHKAIGYIKPFFH